MYNLQFSKKFLKVPPGVCGGPGCGWEMGLGSHAFLEQGYGADLADPDLASRSPLPSPVWTLECSGH